MNKTTPKAWKTGAPPMFVWVHVKSGDREIQAKAVPHGNDWEWVTAKARNLPEGVTWHRATFTEWRAL